MKDLTKNKHALAFQSIASSKNILFVSTQNKSTHEWIGVRLMNLTSHLKATTQECSQYEPIHKSKSYTSQSIENAGCDSCVHLTYGECEIYNSENRGGTS